MTSWRGTSYQNTPSVTKSSGDPLVLWAQHLWNNDQNNYYTERSQQRSSQKIFVLFCNNVFSERFQSGAGITCQPLIGCSLNSTHSASQHTVGHFFESHCMIHSRSFQQFRIENTLFSHLKYWKYNTAILWYEHFWQLSPNLFYCVNMIN